MNSNTKLLQDSLKSLSANLETVRPLALDAVKMYFATDVSATVGALATDTTMATLNSRLTKAMAVNGYTLCEGIKNFFGNEAVATADRLQTSMQIRSGGNGTPVLTSQATELFGDKAKAVASTMVDMEALAASCIKLYNESQIAACLAQGTDSLVVFGSDMTKAEMIKGVTLAQQVVNLMGNAAVTTGDYYSSLIDWRRIG
jgi:hypothetical protein